MKKISVVNIRAMRKHFDADTMRAILEILSADLTAECWQDDPRFSEHTKHMARLWGDSLSRAYPALLAVSDLIDGYGVENVEGRYNEFDERYYGKGQLECVNMGDTYIPTLMFDNERQEYVWGSWGDFVESHPRRFPDFDCE